MLILSIGTVYLCGYSVLGQCIFYQCHIRGGYIHLKNFSLLCAVGEAEFDSVLCQYTVLLLNV